MYKLFWVGAGPYRLKIGDLNRFYKWYTTYLWVENISRRFAEVWFSVLHGYWRKMLFSILVTLEDKVVFIFWLYWIGWEGWVSLRISDDNNIT